MERKLPVINIENTEFIVDVNKLRIFEKANPQNIIQLADMEASTEGYTFNYSRTNKNFPYPFDRNHTTVKIPEFTVLDPAGMSEKYNCPLDQIKNQSDFELMVNQKAFDLRVNKGFLPTLNIAGHTFYVDIRMDMLRPKDDFLSKGIKFSEIENYYDQDSRSYAIPYNPETHEFQEPDYQNIKEFPKDLINIEFPSERLLDRIGWNRKYGLDIKHGLMKQVLKLEFTAKKVPWGQTFLTDLIKINRRTEKISKETSTPASDSQEQKKEKRRRI